MRLNHAAFAGLLLAAHVVNAQPAPARVPYRIACPTCGISFQRVLSFGSPSDSVLITSNVVPGRDSRGRYFASAAGDIKVVVFDSTGRSSSAFGRQGQGPGEFSDRITRILVGAGDSVYVFHSPLWVSVFSSDLRFVRKMRFPVRDIELRGIAAVVQGGIVYAENRGSAVPDGKPVHLIDGEGRVTRSFGAARRPVVGLPIMLANGYPTVAPTVDRAAVWVAADEGLAFSLWPLNGAPAESVEFVGVPWMPPLVRFDTVVSGRGDSRRVEMLRPHASIHVDHVDGEGRVWVASYLAGGDAANGHPLPRAIHVYDPRSRTLVLRQPVEREYYHLGGDLFVTPSWNADDIVSFVVWRGVVTGGR